MPTIRKESAGCRIAAWEGNCSWSMTLRPSIGCTSGPRSRPTCSTSAIKLPKAGAHALAGKRGAEVGEVHEIVAEGTVDASEPVPPSAGLLCSRHRPARGGRRRFSLRWPPAVELSVGALSHPTEHRPAGDPVHRHLAASARPVGPSPEARLAAPRPGPAPG